MRIQLTLEQIGLNCVGLLIHVNFFNNYSQPFISQWVSHPQIKPTVDGKQYFAFPTIASQTRVTTQVLKILFSIRGWLNLQMGSADCSVKSYTRIFDWPGVGASDPPVVQASTVVCISNN